METLEVLRREIKALAFDQYGTIVDMQRGRTGSGLIERCKNTGRVYTTARLRTVFLSCRSSVRRLVLHRGAAPRRECRAQSVKWQEMDS
jgi:hypothetical protein